MLCSFLFFPFSVLLFSSRLFCDFLASFPHVFFVASLLFLLSFLTFCCFLFHSSLPPFFPSFLPLFLACLLACFPLNVLPFFIPSFLSFFLIAPAALSHHDSRDKEDTLVAECMCFTSASQIQPFRPPRVGRRYGLSSLVPISKFISVHRISCRLLFVLCGLALALSPSQCVCVCICGDCKCGKGAGKQWRVTAL